MDLVLTGRPALVGGGASGIGAGIAGEHAAEATRRRPRSGSRRLVGALP